MRKTPIDIIHCPEKGWLNVGRARMVLFDTLQGFYTLRNVIDKEVGGNAAYLIFQAGIKGGFSFLEPMIQDRPTNSASEGFLNGISVFSDGGFGHFQIEEIAWQKGWAKIACKNSVESWIYSQKSKKISGPMCDYARGILLGFMQASHRYAKTGFEDSLDCVEISCIATGQSQCEFLIGKQSSLTHLGYKCSQPGRSIQEQLKEHVLGQTREIQAATLFNQNIIHSITDGIMVLDSDLRIKTWNREMERIFSIKAEGVLGKNIEDIQPFVDSRFLHQVKEVINSGSKFEEKGSQTKSSSRSSIVVNRKMIPLLNKESQVTGIIVLHEDVTDMERIEIRYRNLFENAQDGICLTDLEGRVISANRKMLKVLETHWQDLKGKSLLDFFPPPMGDNLRNLIKQATQDNEYDPLELEIISHFGKTVPVEISITAVGQGKKIFGIHIISRDISRRKQLEQQMIQTGKLAAVGELASGVAHEINNPLASIAGYAEDLVDLLQAKKNFNNDDRREFVEDLSMIIQQTHRCKEITQNLLEFARTGSFEIINIDINQLIEKTLLLVGPEVKLDKIQIVRRLAPDSLLAETDPSQLQQVFLNLMNNALDAVGPGGLIEVTTSDERESFRISFQDNGVGIPRSNIKKIFEPFFTTKPTGSGTGLGLSICYRIMEKLKGKLEVISQENKGARFTVIIPKRWDSWKENRDSK